MEYDSWGFGTGRSPLWLTERMADGIDSWGFGTGRPPIWLTGRMADKILGYLITNVFFFAFLVIKKNYGLEYFRNIIKK